MKCAYLYQKKNGIINSVLKNLVYIIWQKRQTFK
jgi:hypothetical protein